jgi:drug/metabolite transporter (DMT)-like permease
MGSRAAVGYLLGFIGVVIFGGTLPATRIAVETFDPWFVTFGRAALAGALALPVLAVARPAMPGGSRPALVVISAALVIGFPGLAALALLTVPAAHGGVVLGILPVATSVAAVFLAAERPSLGFWGLSLLGALLVIGFSLRQGGGSFEPGDLLLGAAALCAAIGYALSGRLARQAPGWSVICWALVIALPLTVAAAALFWRDDYLAAPTEAWAAFLYLGLFSMFLGFFAWNAGLAVGGVAHVGQVQLLQVFVTLLIAAAVLGEEVGGDELVFAALVTIVVALTGRTRRAAAGTSPPDAPKT